MNADQRLTMLFRGLANYERTRTMAGPWSLDNMRALLKGQGARADHGTWIQVGGSKGKGTTAHYVEALARAAGCRTGTFVSPHIEHVTERVAIDGCPVAAATLLAALEEVLARAEIHGLSLSFFEAVTAAAVRIFSAQAVDVAVLEVGLGGRLDATTAVLVEGTILTHIELEHTDLLGDTLAEIATEKAHIMRPGVPFWTVDQPETADLLLRHAAAVGAVRRPTPVIEELRQDGAGWLGVMVCAGERAPFRLPAASRFELPALALAWGALRELVPDAIIPLDPVPRPVLPGRFEVVAAKSTPDRGPVVLDGAHTPLSFAQTVEELDRRFPGEPVAVLFATVRGKQWREGLSAMLPRVDRFLVTSVEGTSCVPPVEVVEWLRAQGARADEVVSPTAGLQELLRCPAVRLVAGSFYLVGAVRAKLLHPHV